MHPAPKVLVRGSINADEFFTVPHIVQSGETLASTEYSRRAGGKGANQAVAAAKAGASVQMAGHVGEDGSWLRDGLIAHGVGVDYLLTDPSLPSGRALIQLSTETRDNSIILLPGANHSNIPTSPDVSHYSTILLQNEIPLHHTLEMLREAKEARVRTIFNPSPMLSGAQIKAFPWHCVDILVVNEGEAAELVHHLHDPRMGRMDPTSAVNYQYLAELRRVNGGFSETHLIMTLGANGVCSSEKTSGKEWRIGVGEVMGDVVDTTGAGDCFTGYLAALLSLHPNSEVGSRLDAVLQVCCAASAMCIEREGAAESVPSLAEVTDRMGSH